MQVSTLIELARLLDLALQLVPRAALVAVEADSFGRGTVGRAFGQTLSGRLPADPDTTAAAASRKPWLVSERPGLWTASIRSGGRRVATCR